MAALPGRGAASSFAPGGPSGATSAGLKRSMTVLHASVERMGVLSAHVPHAHAWAYSFSEAFEVIWMPVLHLRQLIAVVSVVVHISDSLIFRSFVDVAQVAH